MKHLLQIWVALHCFLSSLQAATPQYVTLFVNHAFHAKVLSERDGNKTCFSELPLSALYLPATRSAVAEEFAEIFARLEKLFPRAPEVSLEGRAGVTGRIYYNASKHEMSYDGGNAVTDFLITRDLDLLRTYFAAFLDAKSLREMVVVESIYYVWYQLLKVLESTPSNDPWGKAKRKANLLNSIRTAAEMLRGETTRAPWCDILVYVNYFPGPLWEILIRQGIQLEEAVERKMRSMKWLSNPKAHPTRYQQS